MLSIIHLSVHYLPRFIKYIPFLYIYFFLSWFLLFWQKELDIVLRYAPSFITKSLFPQMIFCEGTTTYFEIHKVGAGKHEDSIVAISNTLWWQHRHMHPKHNRPSHGLWSSCPAVNISAFGLWFWIADGTESGAHLGMSWVSGCWFKVKKQALHIGLLFLCS